jgi:hypothetical protein
MKNCNKVILLQCMKEKFCVSFLLTSAIVILSILPVQQLRAQNATSIGSQTPCYTFLRGGALWFSCQGKKESISIGKDARDFAIDPDGRFLVILRYPPTYFHTGINVLDITELHSPFIKQTKQVSFGRLSSTCGTVLAYPIHGTRPIVDIQQMSTLPYPVDAIGCSSDRTVVAGKEVRINGVVRFDGDIAINRNGKLEQMIKASATSLYDFALSPNGKFVAYFERRDNKGLVCSTELDGKEFCSPGPNDAGGERVSVTNAGAVLYEGSLMSTCWYDGNGSPCRSVEYWAPGMVASITLEKIGDSHDPMWISPETARALHDWNQTRLHPR